MTAITLNDHCLLNGHAARVVEVLDDPHETTVVVTLRVERTPSVPVSEHCDCGYCRRMRGETWPQPT